MPQSNRQFPTKRHQTKCKRETVVHTFLPPPSTSAAAPADASALSDCQTASLCGYEDKTHVDLYNGTHNNIICNKLLLTVSFFRIKRFKNDLDLTLRNNISL